MIDSLFEECKADRKDCKSYVGDEVDHIFLQIAQSLKMKTSLGKLVTSINQIGEEYGADPSIENAKRLWDVQFGYWDRNPHVRVSLVELYLKHRQWKYASEPEGSKKHPRQTCGISHIITTRINEVNRCIKKRTNLLCNSYLIKSKPQETLDDGKKKQAKCRIKGVFDSKHFIVRGECKEPSGSTEASLLDGREKENASNDAMEITQGEPKVSSNIDPSESSCNPGDTQKTLDALIQKHNNAMEEMQARHNEQLAAMKQKHLKDTMKLASAAGSKRTTNAVMAGFSIVPLCDDVKCILTSLSFF